MVPRVSMFNFERSYPIFLSLMIHTHTVHFLKHHLVRRSIEFSRQTFVIARKYSNSIGLPNITTLMQLQLLTGKRNFQTIALYKKFFNILYIAINKVYFYKYVKVSVSELPLSIGTKVPCLGK